MLLAAAAARPAITTLSEWSRASAKRTDAEIRDSQAAKATDAEIAAANVTTDAEIRAYSSATVSRLKLDPRCRNIFGTPSAEGAVVATAYDAFPLEHFKRPGDGTCRCGSTEDASEPLPHVEWDSDLGEWCHLVFSLPCAETVGWSCDTVDEVWVTSIPKVGSISVSDTYKALRLNETLRGWQPPRKLCLDDVGKRVQRIALVRDPWAKFVSAVREVQFSSAAGVNWVPWRQRVGCREDLPLLQRDKFNVSTHTARASEFAKNIVRGFDNLHFVSQTEHLFRSRRLPDFVGKLADAAAAWRIFAAGAGCTSPECLTFRAAHTNKVPVAGKKAPCLVARSPAQGEKALKMKRSAERQCAQHELENPTFGLADLDAEAQAAFCSYYAQDYACLGYDVPPECTSPEVLRWSYASCAIRRAQAGKGPHRPDGGYYTGKKNSW